MMRWQYLAWLPGSTSSALMYFSTLQIVHVQFEFLPMMRFLRPRAQHGLAGIGTWSRVISTVLVFARRWPGAANEPPREGRILRSVLMFGAFFCAVTANAYSTKKGSRPGREPFGEAPFSTAHSRRQCHRWRQVPA